MNKRRIRWMTAGVILAALTLALMALVVEAMELNPPYTRDRIVKQAVDTLADPRALLEYVLNRPVAVSKCKGAILRSLRSPSTARFCGARDATEIARKSPGYGNFWTIVGCVEADNAFGVTTRSAYSCKVSNYNVGGWTIQDVSLWDW